MSIYGQTESVNKAPDKVETLNTKVSLMIALEQGERRASSFI